jgi:predicted ATP-grasp superfamily ATP-dependent carboligase
MAASILARVQSVLLVEEGWHATLPIASALADAGHRVTVVTANGRTARWRRASVSWRSGPTIDSPRFLPHLDELAADSDRVLPLTEAVMRRLWSAAGAWQPRLFPRPEPWQQRLWTDKHALVEHAASRGFAVPRHRRIGDAFDPDRAIAELRLPLVVKGSFGCGGRRVCIVESVAALAAALVRARALGGEWIVQEHVAGATYLVGGLFADGEPLRVYAAEKLAQCPARVGGAVHVRSIADRALVDAGIRIMRELRVTGFASADFMRRRDSIPLLLEVNPRLWGSHAGALAAGVDLFAPFVRLLAGDTPDPELAFAPNIETWIFPKYLESRAHRNLRTALRGLRDLAGTQGRDWRDPGFAVYALRRARWMRQLAERL